MSSGAQHYQESERLLKEAAVVSKAVVKIKDGLTADQMIEMAKAYAWLSISAATIQSASGDLAGESEAAETWREIIKDA